MYASENTCAESCDGAKEGPTETLDADENAHDVGNGRAHVLNNRHAAHGELAEANSPAGTFYANAHCHNQKCERIAKQFHNYVGVVKPAEMRTLPLEAGANRVHKS